MPRTATSWRQNAAKRVKKERRAADGILGGAEQAA